MRKNGKKRERIDAKGWMRTNGCGKMDAKKWMRKNQCEKIDAKKKCERIDAKELARKG